MHVPRRPFRLNTEPNTTRRTRRRMLAAGAAVVALTLPLTACLPAAKPAASPSTTSPERDGSPGRDGATGPSTSEPDRRSGRTPGGTPGGSGTVPSGPRTDAEVLDAIGFFQSDLADGSRLIPLPNGTSVAGGATGTSLDLCDATFASEPLRVARNQLVVVRGSMVGDASSEAVAYRDAAATEQAFRELRGAAATCGQQQRAGTQTTYALGPAPDAGWPVVPGIERLTYAVVEKNAGSPDHTAIVSYLRCGRLLVGVYLNEPGQVGDIFAGKPDAAGVVTRMQYRLGALSAGLCDAAPSGKSPAPLPKTPKDPGGSVGSSA